MTGDTINNVFPGSSEIARLMRANDWSSTPLGEPSRWPQSLRTMLGMLLTSRYQMWMGWGPQLHFFYNDAYRPTLGTKHPQALAAPTRQLWAEIWNDIGPRIQHVLDTGEATWDEGLLLLLERNGYPEETYHTFSYSPVFDDHGAVGGMLSVVTEETERVISERRLALMRALSSRLAVSKTVQEVAAAVEEAVPVAERDLPFTLMYLFDDSMVRATLVASTGIAATNAAALPQLDVATTELWPVSEVVARREARLVEPLPTGYSWPTGPWVTAPPAAIVVPIAQQGQTQPAGVLIAGVNPHRPCDESYRSFVDLLVGQIAAGLANARAYEAERRRAEALAEIDRAKTIFFSNVSHEFRTPLTLMLGPMEELAARTDVSSEIHAELDLMRRNGTRLLRLVNTLLDFSRIESGRAQARFEPVDLAAETRELASAFESVTTRAGLRLTVDCAALSQAAYIDRAMWEKIVLNLLSNAFKYTLDGAITVSVRESDRGAVLCVADTGVGIPASELPHLFERFHRVQPSRARSHEGSGIGLALVRELVALHGGVITVASEAGKGTEFTVKLPLGKSHLPPDCVHEQSTLAGATGVSLYVEEALRWVPQDDVTVTVDAPAADATAAVDRARILIADDSADMRDYLARVLGARWQVDAVPNGKAALEAIQTRPPDVVVTDIMMPELDGFQLVDALRADPNTRELPVLMLSARAGDEARVEGIEAGANDYLIKPFSGRELLARVDALLLRSRVRAVEASHARRVRSTFAQAPVAIALLRGPDHVFEMANDRYLEIVGGRDVLGKPLREALPELTAQGVLSLFDQIFESGQPYTARCERIPLRKGSDGPLEDRFFDLVFQPLVDDDGRVEGIAAVGYDVTDLAQARAAAEVANRAKDEFLAMLGHELRNPLAPILTALHLLRLRGVTAADAERLVIERQVNHLVSLVDDLLDVSRITGGKIQLNCSAVEIGEVVARAVETASPLLEQKGHQLHIEVPERGLTVQADPARLAQVISNLLTNAAKYTEPGGHITITARADADRVSVRVRDTGIGIAPEILPRIFDLFVQERQALDRAQGGLGLGLAIVRSLVTLHGGEVAARSEGAGRGSEFEVRLPRIGVAESVPVPELPLVRATSPDRTRRVLIVDDNYDAAVMLATALNVFGHVTCTASDGPQALALAATFNPDIALLDIGLPVMDGYQLARRFAADSKLQQVYLIAITGYGQEQDRSRSASAGFAQHLVKPVNLEKLRDIVESVALPCDK